MVMRFFLGDEDGVVLGCVWFCLCGGGCGGFEYVEGLGGFGGEEEGGEFGDD